MTDERLEESRHAALFRVHEVVRVRSCDFNAFPHCQLAHSSSSVGLCAYDGEARTYLHLLEPEGLGAVLKKEGSAFFDAQPLALAELFAELASEGLRALPSVVTGDEAPRVETREAGGWVLTFRSEGLPRRSDIGRVEVRISKDFEVRFDVALVAENAVEDDDIRPF